jgi:anti-anti-sigma factor
MSSYTPPFAIKVASAGDGSVRVEVQGELDLSTTPAFDQAVRQELDAGKTVVVDLSQIAFIDSTGLNALITAMRASDSNGGTLAVSPSLPDQVRRLFQITGLDAVLPIASD